MRRRAMVVAMLLSAVLVVSGNLSTAARAAQAAHSSGSFCSAATSAVVLVSALNLRASPSSAGSIRAILNEGTHLTLVAYHGQWVRVTTDDGKSGWVLARFIGPAPLGRFAVVLVPALNLRARPSFTGAVRDVLPQGTRLTVLASHGQWARVRTDGARGWVLACFLGSATGTT